MEILLKMLGILQHTPLCGIAGELYNASENICISIPIVSDYSSIRYLLKYTLTIPESYNIVTGTFSIACLLLLKYLFSPVILVNCT